MTQINFMMILLLPAFLGIASFATPVLDGSIPFGSVHSVGEVSARAANTCADPSLTQTIFQVFSASLLAHSLRFHWGLVNDNTQLSTGTTAWSFQGPVFNAWASQQPFTVPLFQLTTPTLSDFMFMTGIDAQTPPVVSGFNANNINLWVYNTSVCGSVPLMSANLASKSDHYYTTNPVEHAALLADGWTDSGVVAFVLPLSENQNSHYNVAGLSKPS